MSPAMKFILFLTSIMLISVIPKITTAENELEMRKFHFSNIAQFFPVNLCYLGFKAFRSQIICNGRVDCADGSDETAELCGKNICSNEFFQCDYGACIPRDQICNGIYNCADGSDEHSNLCDMIDCKVPYPTEVTAYYIKDCNGECGGLTAKDGTILHYVCARNSTADNSTPSTRTVCRNGSWRPFVPRCSEMIRPTTKNISTSTEKLEESAAPQNVTTDGIPPSTRITDGTGGNVQANK